MRSRSYHAACVCGTVRFAVDAIPRRAMPCICPHCRGQGIRILQADPESFKILAGEDMLTETIEGARKPHHFFCRRCGEAVFGIVQNQGAVGQVTVNVACLERGDVEAITIPSREIIRKKKWEI